MKKVAVTAALAMVFMSVQSTSAFSPIANIDSWSVERLGQAGITVSPWKHDLQTEDPPLDWLQVTFDCSGLPKEQDVLMTAWVVSETRTITSLRAERSKSSRDTVTLVFAIQPDYRSQSRVEVYIWKNRPGGGSEAYGYRLSVHRIIELAHQKTAKNADMTKK